MIRYFKQYIDSSKAVEVSKKRAVEWLAGYYKRAWRVLTDLPLEQKIRTPWAIFWKVKTQ